MKLEVTAAGPIRFDEVTGGRIEPDRDGAVRLPAAFPGGTVPTAAAPVVLASGKSLAVSIAYDPKQASALGDIPDRQAFRLQGRQRGVGIFRNNLAC